MISALFVEQEGVYFGLHDVDPWDINRDARLYNGKSPVVAHPPCQLWGKMAIVNYKRWGGEHNKPGNDGGCFFSALDNVRRCGGVLEHPQGSYAWKRFNLDKPIKENWIQCSDGIGWVCCVWQSAYGHLANKATWLYYVGHCPPFDLIWDRPKGSFQVGFQDQRGKARNKPTLGKREANSTPIRFRNELLRLARHSSMSCIANPKIYNE